MRFRVLSLALLTLLFCFAAAADEFTLTASGNGLNISLTLDGTESSTPGVFFITGLSGTVNSATAALLPTTGPGVSTLSPILDSVAFVYDNILNMNSPTYFDFDGLGLSVSDGTLGDLYTPNGLPSISAYLQLTTPAADNSVEEVSLTVTPAVITPEPSSGILAMIAIIVLLLGAGMLGSKKSL